MSNLTKRADGRFVKKVTLPDGTPKYIYSAAKSEREAVKEINAKMLNLENEIKEGKTFSSVSDKWNTEYRKKVPDHNYRKNTRAAYERIVGYFSDNKNIKEITALDIKIFIDKLIVQNYSKKTIATHKCILNMIFRYAVIHRFIDNNPVSDIKLPTNLPQKKRKLPTTAEMKEVNKHYENFDLFPFFVLNTGLRRSEALAITDDVINIKEKRVQVKNHIIHDGNKPIFENVLKTDSAEREVILLDRVIDVLPKFKGFLFSMNGDGKEPLTKSAFTKRWKSYCKKYNLNITPHQLRHGFATMLFEAGVDEKDAQELMGHSDITLTRQIYTHIRSERKEETAKKLNAFNFN